MKKFDTLNLKIGKQFSGLNIDEDDEGNGSKNGSPANASVNAKRKRDNRGSMEDRERSRGSSVLDSPKMVMKATKEAATAGVRVGAAAVKSTRGSIEGVRSEIGRKLEERRNKRRRKKENLLDPLSRSMPRVYSQIWSYLKRSFLVQDKRSVIVDLVLITLSGFGLGLVYGDVEASGNEMYSFAMATMAMGIMAANSVERYFPSETLVFLRETSSGCSATAYFLGKVLAQIPFIIVAPMGFCTFYVTFAAPRCETIWIYLNLLLVTWCCTGAGYFLSLTFSNKAQLACVFYPLLSTMVSGVNPTLPELKGDGFTYTNGEGGQHKLGLGYYFAQLSYSRWSVNMFWHNHSDNFNRIVFPNVDSEMESHGYDEHGVWFCGGVLFVGGLLFRIMAFWMIRNMKVGPANIFTFSYTVEVTKGQT